MPKCSCERDKNATFAVPGESKPKWCVDCPDKPTDAVDVRSQKCACDRNVQPSYGLKGEKAIWCKDCPSKPNNAVYLKSKMCECGKYQPSFGLKDEVAKWCSECPPPENAVSKKRCCKCGRTEPYYGMPGDKTTTWCTECKPEGAVNMKGKKCPCPRGVRPCFGKPGDKTGTWCVNCENKPDDAVNVDSKKCVCGESTQPSFGLESDKKMKWCPKCKPKEAVYLREKGCVCGQAKSASFGLRSDRKRIWCAECPSKPKEAINLKSKICPCDREAVPSFAMSITDKAKWCYDCKPPNAINVKSTRCINTDENDGILWNCDTIVSNKKFRGYCLPCFAELFPTEPVSRNYKTKERLVIAEIRKLLQSSYPHLLVTYDKRLQGGCSKRKPDAFIDPLTHMVVCECDEEQHDTKEYCNCENKRMMQLMEDGGLRPIVFIRLNPDSFTDSKGVKHPSCFKITKTGVLSIRNKKDWETRLDVFIKRLEFHLDNIPTQEVQVEHLYYNGFNI